MPVFSIAEENTARSVYKVDREAPDLPELPIAKGTLSSKIFSESLVVDEGKEKLKYMTEAERKEAELKAILMAKKKEPAPEPAKVAEEPEPTKEVKVTKKEDYPSGTIILLDNTIIKPDQKTVRLASAKKTSTQKNNTKVASKKEIVTKSVRIAYLADESEILGTTRKKLLQFIRTLREKGGGKLMVVTASVPIPLQEEDTLAETRVQYIKAFMREQGVNPEHYEFVATHKKSEKAVNQYLHLELLS